MEGVGIALFLFSELMFPIKLYRIHKKKYSVRERKRAINVFLSFVGPVIPYILLYVCTDFKHIKIHLLVM